MVQTRASLTDDDDVGDGADLVGVFLHVAGQGSVQDQLYLRIFRT